MADRPSKAIQESLLTLLALNDTHGKIAASLVSEAIFDPVYRDIAKSVLDFRTRFGKAPGPAHLDDIFDDVLEDPKNPKAETIKFLLRSILEQGPYVNGEFIVSKIAGFLRHQRLKQAVLGAAARYTQGGEHVADEVEAILLSAVKSQVGSMTAGTRLTDLSKILVFFDTEGETLSLGIPELDRRGIGPTLKEMLLFIAPRKRGKSFFAVHCGRRAIQQRWPAVHVTLEMSERRVAMRYLQSIFGIARRDESWKQTVLEIDKSGALANFIFDEMKPEMTLAHPKVRDFITSRVTNTGMRFGNLIIKEFPTKQLTVKGLESYLDWLEQALGYSPKLGIVDYPDLMAYDMRDARRGVGTTYEELRGVFVARSMAGVTPSQGNRAADTATTTMDYHVAEDISKVGTADNVITYSQTQAERDLKVARLYVSNARNEEDRFTVIISQNYGQAQFVLQSAYMPQTYWEKVNANTEGANTENKEE